MKKGLCLILLSMCFMSKAEFSFNDCKRQKTKIAFEELLNSAETDDQLLLLFLMQLQDINNRTVELRDSLHSSDLHEGEQENIDVIMESLKTIIENAVSFSISYPCDGDITCQQGYISRLSKLVVKAEQLIGESNETDKRLIDYVKNLVGKVQSRIQQKASKKVETEEVAG